MYLRSVWSWVPHGKELSGWNNCAKHFESVKSWERKGKNGKNLRFLSPEKKNRRFLSPCLEPGQLGLAGHLVKREIERGTHNQPLMNWVYVRKMHNM